MDGVDSRAFCGAVMASRYATGGGLATGKSPVAGPGQGHPRLLAGKIEGKGGKYGPRAAPDPTLGYIGNHPRHCRNPAEIYLIQIGRIMIEDAPGIGFGFSRARDAAAGSSR